MRDTLDISCITRDNVEETWLEELSPKTDDWNIDNIRLILEWCLEHKCYSLDIHARDEFAFRLVCFKGHLRVAELLIKLCNETGHPVDIHAWDEEAFRYACRGGHLSIVELLVKIGNETGHPVDIHAWNEEAFRWACQEGHLLIVKLLLRNGCKIATLTARHHRIHASRVAMQMCRNASGETTDIVYYRTWFREVVLGELMAVPKLDGRWSGFPGGVDYHRAKSRFETINRLD